MKDLPGHPPMLSAPQPPPSPFSGAKRAGRRRDSRPGRSGGGGGEGLAHRGDGFARPEPHLVVGDADDAIPGVSQVCIATAVSITVELGAVVEGAVYLDDEPKVWVGEVDSAYPPFPADIMLSNRFWQTGGAKQEEKPCLESTLGGDVIGAPLSQERPSSACCRSVRAQPARP